MTNQEAFWIGKLYFLKQQKAVYIAFDERTFNNPLHLFCSACKTPALLNRSAEEVPSNFCPNCGLKMNRQPTKEQREVNVQ